MATTRLLRPVSLSLALHGALLVGLLTLGGERRPAEAPRVLQVVWVETGRPDLAAARQGDQGITLVAHSDAPPLPVAEASPVEAVENEQPAAADLAAEHVVSAADRPAPAPGTEPTDEPDTIESRTEPADEPDTVESGTEPADEPDTIEEQLDPPVDRRADSRTPGDERSDSPPPTVERSDSPPPAVDSSDSPSPAGERSEPRTPVNDRFATANASTRAVEASAPPSPLPTPSPLPAESTPARKPVSETSPSRPLTAEEQERLREDVLDRLNRSRSLASRPSLAWSRDGREYRAELTPMPAAGAMGIEEAVLEITTSLDGRQVSTEVRLKRLAFSHYAQLIDRWDPSVQIHDDVIEGRFHSNSEILIENSGDTHPVFHGMVTTAGGINTSRSSRRVRRDEVFRGGLDTRSPRITLPRRFTPLEAFEVEDADSTAADSTRPGADNAVGADVITLDRDTHITFRADGSYVLRRMQDGSTRTDRLSAAPTYFVAAGKTTVGAKGIVNGKVLVYSAKEIVIEGDLVYAADPTLGAASDDYLGLVSDGTIEVAEADVTGDGDLTIHAAIYARGRFSVRRYSRGDRATLTIHGSLSAGSLSATEPRFRTKLVFDPRLEDSRPPSFPMTDRYEIASWDGVWRAASE